MRDYVSEIIEIRNRQAGSENIGLIQELSTLEGKWYDPAYQRDILRNYIPIRIATILEVISRNWIAILIDHGEPFRENAIGISKNIAVKFDLPLILAMQGEKITLGELIAHSLSYNNIEQISSNLSAIIGQKLKLLVEQTQARTLDENFNPRYQRIISDVDGDYAALEKLFKARHIIVHELPKASPAADDELEKFLNASNRFATALEISLYTMLYGEVPLTQYEMNAVSANKYHEAMDKLQELIKAHETADSAISLEACQTKWLAYKAAHCELVSGIKEPFHGSMAPMIYASCAERMTQERIELLTDYFNKFANM